MAAKCLARAEQKAVNAFAHKLQSFKRSSRLLKPQDYSGVFQQTAYRSGDDNWLVLARENQTKEARLGLAISKKNNPLAVGRNRLKRIARESFRLHRAQLAGLDIVVLNRPASTFAKNPVLFDALAKHWSRIVKRSETNRRSEPLNKG